MLSSHPEYLREIRESSPLPHLVTDSVVGAIGSSASEALLLSEEVFRKELKGFLQGGPAYYSSQSYLAYSKTLQAALSQVFNIIDSKLKEFRLLSSLSQNHSFEALISQGEAPRLKGEVLPAIGESSSEISEGLGQVRKALSSYRTSYAFELLDDLDRLETQFSENELFLFYSYRSEALMRTGQIEEARDVSRKASSLKPADEKAFSRYVGTILGTGEAENALRLVNEFLVENPGSLSCVGRKIEILGRLGKSTEIFHLIENLDDNASAQLAGTIALSLFYCGLFEEAEEYGRRAVLHKSDDVEAKVFLGEIISEKIRRLTYESDGPAGYLPPEWLAQLGEANMLLSDAISSLKKDDTNFLLGHARLLLAVNLFRLEDQSAAKRELELASTTPGNDENVARVRFSIAAREFAISPAIQLWQDFDETDRQRFAFPMAGLWLEKNERRKCLEIIESFDWPEDSAEYFQALVLRNLCYFELGETEQAKATLAEMKALGGANHIDVVEAEVREMVGANELEGAHSRLLTALDLTVAPPVRQRLEIALARLSLRIGDSDSAVSWFALNPDVASRPIYVTNFLESCIKAGDYERAREVAESVLSSYPNFLPALRSLQAYYRRLGKHEECLKIAETILANPELAFLDRIQAIQLHLDAEQLESGRRLLEEAATKFTYWQEGLQIAGLFVRFGEQKRALETAYRAKRLGADVVKVNEFYASLCIRYGAVEVPAEVAQECSVLLSFDGGTSRWYDLLASSPVSEIRKEWLADGPIGQQLLGRKVGDDFTLIVDGRSHRVEVCEIQSVYVRAFRELLEDSKDPGSPYSFKVFEIKDGENPIEAIQKGLESFGKLGPVEELPQELPVQAFTSGISGTRSVAWLDALLDSRRRTRISSISGRLQALPAKAVIDSSSLLLMAALGLLKSVKLAFPEIVVPGTLKMELDISINTLGASTLLHTTRDFVISETAWLPLSSLGTFAPKQRRELEEVLGQTLIDSLILGQNLDCPVWCDEAIAANILNHKYPFEFFGSQDVLRLLLRQGLLGLEDYIEAKCKLASWNCVLVSWSIEELCFLLGQKKFSLGGPERLALRNVFEYLKPEFAIYFAYVLLVHTETKGPESVEKKWRCQKAILEELFRFVPQDTTLRRMRAECYSKFPLRPLWCRLYDFDFETMLRIFRRDYPNRAEDSWFD